MERRTGIAMALMPPLALLGTFNVHAVWNEDPLLVAEFDSYWRFCRPGIVTDMSGCVIVAWGECVDGRMNLRVNKYDAFGRSLWDSAGVLLSCCPGPKGHPRIITDGSGGAIVTWLTSYNGWSIIAQRIGNGGKPMWGGEGVTVCECLGFPEKYHIAPDGRRGVYIVWTKSVRTNSYVYAQRISSKGNTCWRDGGIALSSGRMDMYHPVVVPDGAGGAIAAWMDMRWGNWDIYAQRIDPSGVFHWRIGGVPVCSARGPQGRHTMVPDDTGGAVLAWVDGRSGGWDIYALRIDPYGCAVWAADGVPVCTAPFKQGCPKAISDGAGGAVIAWVDRRRAAARVVRSMCEIAFYVPYERMEYCECVYGKWTGRLREPARRFMAESDPDADEFVNIYCQRIDGGGAVRWGPEGIAVSPSGALQWDHEITTDASGGAIVSWRDFTGQTACVRAQNIDRDGRRTWGEVGIAVSSDGRFHQAHRAVSDQAGGTLVAWVSWLGGGWAVHSQGISPAGVCGRWRDVHYAVVAGENRITLTWPAGEGGKASVYLAYRAASRPDSFTELPGAAIREDMTGCSLTDGTVEPGGEYCYRIDCIDGLGRRTLFRTGAIRVPDLPVTLYQNFPNPFNPATAIRYYLPSRGRVVLSVYDVAGREIAVLLDDVRDRGFHSVRWDGSNRRGRAVSPGVYYYRIVTGGEMVSRKMVVLR